MFNEKLEIAIICMALVSALPRADAADRPESPMHELFTQELQPSDSAMQNYSAAADRSPSGMTIYIKMTKISATTIDHDMKAHPNINCRVQAEPHERSPSRTMILVCC